MKKVIVAIISTIVLLTAQEAHAQKIRIGTNLISWMNFATLNMEAGYSISQKWSAYASAEYNPWNFRTPDGLHIRNRHLSLNAGGRYWFWFVNSGWFAGTGGKWTVYNRGGITGKESSEGERYGIAIHGGYSLMLGKHWNIEFAAGLSAGGDIYTRYSCTDCGRLTGKGRKFYIEPDNIKIQFVYIF